LPVFVKCCRIKTSRLHIWLLSADLPDTFSISPLFLGDPRHFSPAERYSYFERSFCVSPLGLVVFPSIGNGSIIASPGIASLPSIEQALHIAMQSQRLFSSPVVILSCMYSPDVLPSSTGRNIRDRWRNPALEVS